MDAQPLPLDCGHVSDKFGTQDDGKRYCYPCCAGVDIADMSKDGRATLYIQGNARDGYCIVNWPGSLSFPVTHYAISRRGGGFGSQRIDAWFRGMDGHEWHAINRGDRQLARCYRTKRRWAPKVQP